jgi:hypothetical protein
MKKVVLLGPQRLTPTVIEARKEMGLRGRTATVTAGWQEREGEDAELDEALSAKTVNLALYHRAEDVFRRDPELSAAYKKRQQRLREMQDLYRFRLEHALEAASVIGRWKADPALVFETRNAAIEEVRRLDAEHLDRCRAVHGEFETRWHPAERDAVARHRSEIAARVEGSEAVAIAGGHVAVLLNRLRVFDVAKLLRGKIVFAWSAGAMALAERVVLFHDHPPQGPGAAEVLDAGLGLCPRVVPLPHWRRRLRVEDRAAVSLMATRFAPAACMAMDDGARMTFDGRRWSGATGVQRLAEDGGLEAVS